MDIKSKITNTAKPPIQVLQYGEGKFLRAFADYFIDIANESGVFFGSVAVVQPISSGNLQPFKEQDNKYTVILRGKENGKKIDDSRLITCISKALSCYENYEEYMALAELDSLKFIISNTTEAGIALHLDDDLEKIPSSFPGKLTQFLYRRYQIFHGDLKKGFIILPVELIDDNGSKLKEYVICLAEHNNYPREFIDWVNRACVFCNTLVDRIVTGFPTEEAEYFFDKIGYKDALLDVAEPFGLWVIESKQDISGHFPLHKANLPIVFTDNCRPYKERKVRILNGAHTSMAMLGWLLNLSTVKECMDNTIMRAFTEQVLSREIVPFINLPANDAASFAAAVLERFENPFIHHKLLDISLNSVPKWRERILPSFRDYYNTHHACPPLLTFSFAALLKFYSGKTINGRTLYAQRDDGTDYQIKDDESVLTFFLNASALPIKEYVRAVAENTSFWHENLTEYKGFCSMVEKDLADIQSLGAAEAAKRRIL